MRNWNILIKTQADALFEEWTYNRFTLTNLDFQNELQRRVNLIDPSFDGAAKHLIEQHQISDYLRERFINNGELGIKDYLLDQLPTQGGDFIFMYKPLPELQLFEDLSITPNLTTNPDFAGWEDTVCEISPFEIMDDISLDAWLTSEVPATSLAIAELANVAEEINHSKDQSKETEDQIEDFEDDIIIH